VRNPYNEDTVRNWIEVLQYESKIPLTKWEEDFTDSLLEQLDDGRTLTDNQLEKLEQIYADKT
jgi:hypothetical protein